MAQSIYKLTGRTTDMVKVIRAMRMLNSAIDLKSAKNMFNDMLDYPKGDYTISVVNNFDKDSDPDRWANRVREITDALNALNSYGVTVTSQTVEQTAAIEPVASPNAKLIELLKAAVVEATNVNHFDAVDDLINALRKVV